MAALTKDRDTPSRGTGIIGYRVAASVRIFAGSLVAIAAGYAQPATATPGLLVAGRANHHVDNRGGAAGDLVVEVERGMFRFAQDGTITQADVGSVCYAVDDQTVADNDAGGTRSAAGVIRGIETAGVWVEIS
ncbi:MAG TPA: hypothetical protein VGB92_25925 [Longimicrobium sp.]|jgi:hypothetical protein